MVLQHGWACGGLHHSGCHCCTACHIDAATPMLLIVSPPHNAAATQLGVAHRCVLIVCDENTLCACNVTACFCVN